MSEKHLPVTVEVADAILDSMGGRVVVARVQQVGSLVPDQPEVTDRLTEASLRSRAGRPDEDAPRTLRLAFRAFAVEMTDTDSGIVTNVAKDGTLHVSMGPGDVSVRLLTN